MRRLYSFIAGILAIVALLFTTSFFMRQESGSAKDKLVIYNWGDYIDPELLTKFTEETGIKIQYETFDSNEAMYTKIRQGGTTYDIAVPSDYMIDQMRKEGLLMPLDKAKLDFLDEIDPRFLNQSFDPDNNYSIPYFWGTVGIVYNETMVEEAPEHWDDLWREEYRNDILLVDGAREVMGFGLNSLGYSLNSKDDKELEEVQERLNQLTPNVKAIVGDELKHYMIQGDAAIGVSFSGEASEMLDGNEDLVYVVPSEGTNLWFDNIVIPKSARHHDEAYQFINFLMRPENAAQNAEYIGYATPSLEAKKLLPEEITADKAFYPEQETIDNLEVYGNLGRQYLGLYNDLYLQFKMYRK